MGGPFSCYYRCGLKPSNKPVNEPRCCEGLQILSRRTHIVDFDEARAQRSDYSARASARVAAAARLARRQQHQESRRRARDAREAGVRRGNSMPLLGRSRKRSSQPGNSYPIEWDEQDSVGFDDYGEYAYDASEYDFSEYDTDEVDEYEEQAAPVKESWVKRFQRRNRKRRAERESARAIADDVAPATDAPRAAFYEMKMGAKHRTMVRSQQTQSARAARASRMANAQERTLKLPPRALRVVAATLVCIVAIAAFLYPAVRDYYVAVRDHDKAEVAVQLAQERNAILEQDVAALATPEGIEDRVRSEYGWVKEGENAVVVTGLRDSEEGYKRLEELPAVESVQAPDTWYSDVLDPVFGYEG